MVKTFKLWERSQLHGTPSIQRPRGSRGTSRPRSILPVSSKALSSVGRWAKSEKLPMSVHWNIAWTTSWGKRKGICTISSFCFLSNHTGISAQYKGGQWELFRRRRSKSRALLPSGLLFPARSVTWCVPAALASANREWARWAARSPLRNKSDKLARKRLSGGKVPGS